MKIRKYGIALAAIMFAAIAAPAAANQPLTESQADDQVQSVAEQLAASGETNFTVATDGESIVVTLTSQSVQAQTLARVTRKAHVGRIRAAVPVKVRMAKSVGSTLANLVGGGTFLSDTGQVVCTGAFTVVKNGVRGMLTAGHCPSSPASAMDVYVTPQTVTAVYTTGFKNAHFGAWGDFAWWTLDGTELDNVYTGPGGVYDVTSVKQTFDVGDRADWYGSITDFHDSQRINYTSVTIWFDYPIHIDAMACFETPNLADRGKKGDSGAPVFNGSIAVGVISGIYTVGGQLRMCFSKAKNVDNAIPGLSIATS